MTETEFRTFAGESLTRMQARREACESRWSLSKYRVAEVHESDSSLRFSKGPAADLICRVQIVGSYTRTEKIWRWAWDNPTISEPLKQDLNDVKAFGEEHRIPPLTTAAWQTDSEEIAWGMAALSARILDAENIHRGPLGALTVYMLMSDLRTA